MLRLPFLERLSTQSSVDLHFIKAASQQTSFHDLSDRSFHNFKPFKFTDWENLCSLETSIRGFWGSKLVQCLVGLKSELLAGYRNLGKSILLSPNNVQNLPG